MCMRDTLGVAERLSEAGLEEAVARAIAREVAGNEQRLATKHDLAEVKHDLAEVKHDLAEVKHDLAEVKHDLAELKQEVTSQGAELRQEMASQGAELRQEMASQGAELKQMIRHSETRVLIFIGLFLPTIMSLLMWLFTR